MGNEIQVTLEFEEYVDMKAAKEIMRRIIKVALDKHPKETACIKNIRFSQSAFRIDISDEMEEDNDKEGDK